MNTRNLIALRLQVESKFEFALDSSPVVPRQDTANSRLGESCDFVQVEILIRSTLTSREKPTHLLNESFEDANAREKR